MNTMDHRIAERRHEVTEERARGRLRWLIWLVLLVVVVAAAIWLVNSPILSIRTVTVTGAERTDPAAIANDLGVRAGTPTMSVKGGAIEAALLESPWVAEADVTVSWPGSVEIDVRERIPVASISTDLGVFDVALDGVLVERTAGGVTPPTIRSDGDASIPGRRPDQPCRNTRSRSVRRGPVSLPPTLDHGDGIRRVGRRARRSVHRRARATR